MILLFRFYKPCHVIKISDFKQRKGACFIQSFNCKRQRLICFDPIKPASGRVIMFQDHLYHRSDNGLFAQLLSFIDSMDLGEVVLFFNGSSMLKQKYQTDNDLFIVFDDFNKFFNFYKSINAFVGVRFLRSKNLHTPSI